MKLFRILLMCEFMMSYIRKSWVLGTTSTHNSFQCVFSPAAFRVHLFKNVIPWEKFSAVHTPLVSILHLYSNIHTSHTASCIQYSKKAKTRDWKMNHNYKEKSFTGCLHDKIVNKNFICKLIIHCGFSIGQQRIFG